MARRKTSHKQPATVLPAQAAADQAMALSKQADELFRQQEVRQALTLLEKAQKILSPYPHISVNGLYRAMAKCFQALGQNNNALKAIEKELAVNPDDMSLKHLQKYLQSPFAQSQNINLIFDGQTAPAKWPAVSLCMIVKNEEKHLADCLRSVGDFPSEIIVLDTGSTDCTVEVAQEFGARVEHFEWCDDFAAARNESIKYAAGDWIFWMDADDRLPPLSLNQLKQALVSNKADVYYATIKSIERGKVTQASHQRLFRNGLGICFERALHEQLNAHEFRLVIAKTNIMIEHIGYDVSPAAAQKKYRRNSQIIQKMIAQNPADLYWRHHLGVCLAGLGEDAAAVQEFEQVLVDPPVDLPMFDIVQTFALSINAYHNLDKTEQLEKILTKAVKAFPNSNFLHAHIGYIYLLRGRPDLALKYFAAAQTMPLPVNEQGLTFPETKINHWLSRAYLQLSKMPQARRYYLRSLEPQDDVSLQAITPVDYDTATRLVEAENYQQLIDLFNKQGQRDAEMSRFLAQAYGGLKQWGNATKALENAIILSEARSNEWAWLAEYTAKSPNPFVAQYYCGLALTDNPYDVKALNLAGILAQQYHKNSAQAIDYFIQAVVEEPDFTPAFNNFNQLAGALNRSPQALLREHGQRLLSQKNYQAAVNVFSVVLEKFPDDGETYRWLAVALQASGRQEDALLAWQTAAQLQQQG